MKNKFSWYDRYYVQNSDVDTSPAPLDSSFSDMMYDSSKGVAGAFVPLGDSSTRFVSDSEIAFSTSPDITSRFSAQHRQIVASGIASQPHSPAPIGKRPTDDQLMENGGIRPLERDEAIRSIRVNSRLFDRDISSARLDMNSQKPPTSTPSVSPAPVNNPNPS